MLLEKTSWHMVWMWLLLLLVGLGSRYYVPIDETRYVTVAWNMWLSGDYLVPSLNGMAYSHKPPMLFWLINLGWHVLGVNDWWPRVLTSLFGLANIFLTRNIACQLWPQQSQTKYLAAWILLGSSLWVIFSTALMFDMLLAFFTLLAVRSILCAYAEIAQLRWHHWFYLALALGGGLLAKGPTILLQTLPLALLATWWAKATVFNLRNWYLPLLYAVLGGVGIALLWAVPASLDGGRAYEYAIFWGQTANRMVDSFAHHRPFWWYLPVLPVLLFPWLLWGNVWQGLRANKTQIANDLGLRFCLAWCVPVFLAFCFISGKQAHYLLPIFPAIAMIFARALYGQTTTTRRQRLPVIVLLLLIAAALWYLPQHNTSSQVLNEWLHAMPHWLEILCVLLALMLGYAAQPTVRNSTRYLALVNILLVNALVFGMSQATGLAYDIRPISAKLKALEDQHIALANLAPYPGIYNFAGRMLQSPSEIGPENVNAWFKLHPTGRLIAYFEPEQALDPQYAEYVQDYQKMRVAILTQAQWQYQQTLTQ